MFIVFLIETLGSKSLLREIHKASYRGASVTRSSDKNDKSLMIPRLSGCVCVTMPQKAAGCDGKLLQAVSATARREGNGTNGRYRQSRETSFP